MANAEVIEFDPDQPGAVVERMHTLALHGKGWINVQPGFDEEEPPPTPGLMRVFSARGPVVPLSTWVARERTRRGVEYVSVGIQHATGPKAVARLKDQGHLLPDQTLVLADHPKRGLVVAFSVDAPHADVLGWLVGATRLLSDWPIRSPWTAAVYPS